jgi:hypothetical protein
MRGGKSSIRKHDGWFHPSTHPLWEERQLYYYVTEGANAKAEPLDPIGIMATTAGTFWHEFIQHVMLEAGILKEVEVYVEDSEVMSRGSMDGVLDDEAWELKSMNGMKLNKLANGAPDSPEVVESFKLMVPGYYAQAQEYLRMSGYRTMRFTILEPSYPFTMREVAIPFDHGFALGIRDKYLRVRQAVADQRLPPPCCSPGSATARSCFAREVCPVGRLTV